MAISVLGSGYELGSDYTQNLSYTCHSGSNRKLIAWVTQETSSVSPSATVTYNGVSLTEISSEFPRDDGDLFVTFFYLDEASFPGTPGSYTLSNTTDFATRKVMGVIELDGAVQGDVHATTDDYIASSTSLTDSIATTEDDTVVVSAGCGSSSSSTLTQMQSVALYESYYSGTSAHCAGYTIRSSSGTQGVNIYASPAMELMSGAVAIAAAGTEYSDDITGFSSVGAFGSIESTRGYSDTPGTIASVGSFGSLTDEVTVAPDDVVSGFSSVGAFGSIEATRDYHDIVGTIASVGYFGTVSDHLDFPVNYYDFQASARAAWAIYALDSFGHDTRGNYAWERRDTAKDLVLGDGANTNTFPAFISNAEHQTSYYSFDGVDDHFSNWPEMPETFTVIVALSGSYPDGKPYVQSCNDDTIQTLLTTPGAFTGNVHNILIFDRVLEYGELQYSARYQLRRLWRDTFVDPFTARMIRDGDCRLCLYCEEEAARFDNYSDSDPGVDYQFTTFAEGLRFPGGFPPFQGQVTLNPDPALNLNELTLFVEAPNFDTEAGTSDTIIENGTNYALTVGDGEIDLNGSTFEFEPAGYRTLAVTAANGQRPRFYFNGAFVGEGDVTVSISPIGADQVVIGNSASWGSPFQSVLKKLSIYSRVLADEEIWAAHVMARTSRPFTE